MKKRRTQDCGKKPKQLFYINQTRFHSSFCLLFFIQLTGKNANFQKSMRRFYESILNGVNHNQKNQQEKSLLSGQNNFHPSCYHPLFDHPAFVLTKSGAIMAICYSKKMKVLNSIFYAYQIQECTLSPAGGGSTSNRMFFQFRGGHLFK